MALRVLLASAAFLLLFAAQAEERTTPAAVAGSVDPLDQFRGRIGMELQLDRQAVGRLAQYFDFSRVPTSELPEGLIRDYLSDVHVFRSLPEEVQRELAGGTSAVSALEAPAIPVEQKRLDLSAVRATPAPREPKAQPQGLKAQGIVRDSKPLPKGFEVGQLSGLILPKGAEEDARLLRANHEAARQWRSIQDAWNRLPKERQAALVQPENLSPDKKAAWIMNSGLQKLPLKADAPVELRQTLKRLETNLASPILRGTFEYLEFVHKRDAPSASIREFLTDLYTLAKYAGVEQQIRQPSPTQRRSAGFHYHISVPDAPAVRSNPRDGLLAIHQRMNVLRLLRMVEGGWAEAVIRPDQVENPVIYRELRVGSYLSGGPKGLMRSVSRDRLESRGHFQDPETEIRELLSYTNKPEVEALAALDAEIDKHLNPRNLERFRGPDGLRTLKGILAEAGPGMKPESRNAAVTRAMEIAHGIEKIEKSADPFLWLAAHFPEQSATVMAEKWKPELNVHADPVTIDRIWDHFRKTRKADVNLLELFLVSQRTEKLLDLAKDDPALMDGIFSALERIVGRTNYNPWVRANQLLKVGFWLKSAELSLEGKNLSALRTRAERFLLDGREGRIPGAHDALRGVLSEMVPLSGEGSYDRITENYLKILAGSPVRDPGIREELDKLAQHPKAVPAIKEMTATLLAGARLPAAEVPPVAAKSAARAPVKKGMRERVSDFCARLFGRLLTSSSSFGRVLKSEKATRLAPDGPFWSRSESLTYGVFVSCRT